MNHAVNWEAISAIGQIVGAVALVISLIYVASEVRRNTRATHLAAIRSMHDAFNRWIQQIAEHPQLTDVISYGVQPFPGNLVAWYSIAELIEYAVAGAIVGTIY